MGAQITGARLPWLLSFVWWKVEGKGKGKIHPRTVLEDPVEGSRGIAPQSGTGFMSPLWRRGFCGVSSIFGKFVQP